MTTPLDNSLARELDRILSEIQSANEELEQVLCHQDELLVVADAAGLKDSASKQNECVQRLQALLSRREEWLHKATHQGEPVRSITEWVRQTASPNATRWLDQLAQIKQSTERVRRQTWRQWVVVQGAHRHQSELLQLIARNGRKTVGYGPSAQTESRGGAILDASA